MTNPIHIITNLKRQTLIGWRDIWFLALGFCLTALGIIAVGIFVGWYEPFCAASSGNEFLKSGACFREWLGSLSGWAAALAAIYAAHFAIKPFRIQAANSLLEKRIKELRKKEENFEIAIRAILKRDLTPQVRINDLRIISQCDLNDNDDVNVWSNCMNRYFLRASYALRNACANSLSGKDSEEISVILRQLDRTDIALKHLNIFTTENRHSGANIGKIETALKSQIACMVNEIVDKLILEKRRLAEERKQNQVSIETNFSNLS